MEVPQGEQVLIQQRLEALEREVLVLKSMLPGELLGTPASDDSELTPEGPTRAIGMYHVIDDTKRLKKMKMVTVRHLLHSEDLLSALATFAQAETERVGSKERLLLVASADEETAFQDGPISAQALLSDDHLPFLATLCAACGHPIRAKLLQTLYLRGECFTTELSEISGATGGNLYQHLNELHRVNLLAQPARGRYCLTRHGRLIVEMLFWSAVQVRQTLLHGDETFDLPRKMDLARKMNRKA